MNKQNLLTKLLSINKATMVSFVAETTERLPKKHHLYGLKKVSKVNGVINFIYENSVNNQRLRENKENDFVSMPRKWGERISGTPIVVNGEEYYLEVKVEKAIAKYYFNNKEIVPDLPQKNNYSRQGLDKQVILRDYNLSNIKSITINKEEFCIV